MENTENRQKMGHLGMIWGIIFLSLMFSMGIVSAWSSNTFNNSLTSENLTFFIQNGYCYQETANISIICGGLNTGSYEFSEIETNQFLSIDTNWSSGYDMLTSGEFIDINYTKPLYSQSAKWQIKGNKDFVNITIPINCFNQSNLRLRIKESPHNTLYQCYNGISYDTLYSSDVGWIGYFTIYEEAIIWDFGITRYLSIPDSVLVLTKGYLNLSAINNNTINLSLYIGTNKVLDYLGNFTMINNKTLNLASIINKYLNTTYLIGTNYLIPFIFHSDTGGVLQYSDLIFSNDGFIENSQTYSTSTYETSNELFNINLTYDSSYYSGISGTLIYNGTSYTGTKIGTGNTILFSKTLTIPSYAIGSNTSFYWLINYQNLFNSSDNGIIQTATINQSVNPILLYDCSSSTNQTLNFTAYHEVNLTSLSLFYFLGTFEYWLGSGTIRKNVSINDLNVGSSALCINPSVNITYKTDAIIQYESTGYVKRNYYLYNISLTNISQAINLYLLGTADATAFIISVKDGSQLPITDAYIYIQRYYPGTGLFQTVAMAKTDGNGNTVAHFEVETEDYKIIVMKNGVIIYSSPVQKVYCSATPCALPIQTSSAGISGWSHVGNLTNLIYTGPTYDSITKIISYTYIDTSGTTHYGRLWVYTIDAGKGKQTVIDSSTGLPCNINSTSNAATLVCNIANVTGTVYAEGYISRSPEVLVWAVSWIINTIKSIMGMEGLFWAFVVIMVLAIGGMLMGGITGGILGSVLGLIGTAWIGIASFGTVTIFGAIILGVVIIWLIKN